MAIRSLLVYAFSVSIISGAIPGIGHSQQRPPAQAERELLRNGDAIRGRLSFFKTKHPNGTPIEVFRSSAQLYIY